MARCHSPFSLPIPNNLCQGFGMRNLFVLPVLLLTLFLGTPVFSADFQKGLTAYKSGDYATALLEWIPLAKQGNASAQYNLGVMYNKGRGVPKNFKTAVKWWKLAAEQGNASAQYNLGVMYRKGLGVPQDYKTAVKWYRLAAEQGDPDAQYSLGLRYAKGQGVPQDNVYAHMWFNIAAVSGESENASKNRDIVAKRMTPSQLEKAQDLARNFVPRKGSPPVIARKSPTPTPRRRTNPDKVVSASSGSGFAVSSSGHVITNYHVIEGCQRVKIHHNGKTIPAIAVTFDPKNDLALLKGDFRPSTVLSLSTKSPELLQDVYVAGYPFGRRISTGVKVTKGIISSLTGIGNNFSQIQIDAALQPGNSGGPILDGGGNVVGVAVAKLDIKKILKNYGVLPENTNFGIKTNVVRSILESSGVSLPSATRSSISKSKLGKMIADGTYYLSCWMTTAQIEKMRSKKVIFQNLD